MQQQQLLLLQHACRFMHAGMRADLCIPVHPGMHAALAAAAECMHAGLWNARAPPRV